MKLQIELMMSLQFNYIEWERLNKAQKSIEFEGRVIFNAISSQDALQALENREVDIAITRFKPVSSDLVAKKFITNRPRLVRHKRWTKG